MFVGMVILYMYIKSIPAATTTIVCYMQSIFDMLHLCYIKIYSLILLDFMMKTILIFIKRNNYNCKYVETWNL